EEREGRGGCHRSPSLRTASSWARTPRIHQRARVRALLVVGWLARSIRMLSRTSSFQAMAAWMGAYCSPCLCSARAARSASRSTGSAVGHSPVRRGGCWFSVTRVVLLAGVVGGMAGGIAGLGQLRHLANPRYIIPFMYIMYVVAVRYTAGMTAPKI